MRAVAFNAETARVLARMSDEWRDQPSNKIERKRNKDVLREFNVIVAKSPEGGIAVGATGVCQVQQVSQQNGLSNAGYTKNVSNIFGSAIGSEVTIVAIRVDNDKATTERFVAISEDCP